jgi:hypothetical protein
MDRHHIMRSIALFSLSSHHSLAHHALLPARPLRLPHPRSLHALHGPCSWSRPVLSGVYPSSLNTKTAPDLAGSGLSVRIAMIHTTA